MTVDIKKHEMLAQVIENRMTIHQEFFRKSILFYYIYVLMAETL